MMHCAVNVLICGRIYAVDVSTCCDAMALIIITIILIVKMFIFVCCLSEEY